MKIRIAHSPDSDDAFMFYGLASGNVPSPGFELEHVLSDIETLNQAAFKGTYEISAVSFHAYAHLTDRYVLLPHGASMGDRYGPIVVARADGPSSLRGVRVAVPGLLTTAFLTLRLFEPGVEHVVVPFDEIQDRVCAGEFAAGLLIHEGQLTYADDGLKKVVIWRVVGDAPGTAIAARRQRHSPGPRAVNHPDALAAAARQHRCQPVASR
jgi:1,4-dihydroxy-6-naphthoate synthase